MKYAVRCEAHFTVHVDGRDEIEALDAAAALAHAVLPRLVRKIPGDDELPRPALYVDVVGELPPETRTETYTCSKCGASRPKILWGPGWMTCPACGAFPGTAEIR